MRILYIPSGFSGVYHFFDDCIVRECNNEDNTCSLFNHYKGFNSLKSKVEEFKPDLVLTLTGFLLSSKMTEWLKSQNIKLAVWMTEDPYYMDASISVISRYDYVFTIDRSALEFYLETCHPNAYLLPLGTDSNIFSSKIDVDEKQMHDICLVGFPYPERINIINLLLEKTSYSIQVVGTKWKDELEQWKENKLLKIIDWSAPEIVARYYNNAKIVLNTHRPYDLGENKNSMKIINKGINNRTFDVAACGAFQLISYQSDLYRYFSENEMVAFKGEEDLLSKICFYINNEKKRKQIAIKAREKVLKHHTFANRIKELTTIIQKNSFN
ncbi:glycosyltransferase [Priestia megaterium]